MFEELYSDEFDMCEEESDESLGQIVEQMKEKDNEFQDIRRQTSDITKGDWAFIKFSEKKKIVKYFVGQVLTNDTAPDEVHMKFTRKTVFK